MLYSENLHIQSPWASLTPLLVNVPFFDHHLERHGGVESPPPLTEDDTFTAGDDVLRGWSEVSQD